MCLSVVYSGQKDSDSLVVEEASRVEAPGGGKVVISTLFGGTKTLEGYSIKEVDLLKNFIVLQPEGEANG
jgi:predicted RNA-binding protein